ncbi:uncharacterized protein RHOBADRAFT_48304 [Rhodotorula graminis WP1]|uniref:Alpha N-terminal protein methyltransferase 1 n=1 Tax=Rhodotorula graminis (strain WP1) TaxID=578459 RepID=A0A194S8P1_RHOGW|nr:uncharacterized protein RHOBADRAFT_48304 [Rhodotorula graminis WP1]KPV75776.1 hypothetical protein RHOBADRAFT_48304 [Rhodotorula graminis WP1]
MADQVPDFEAGVAYWAATNATVDGVLGGYGERHLHRGTPVPRLDATSSRLLILSLLPSLSTITPPHLSRPSPASSPRPSRPFRALDCGAGIGRVTRDTLLPLFDSVDLVEPVPAFVAEAERNARSGRDGWRALAPPSSSVRIWKAGLQHFDPLRPAVPVVDGSASAKVELAATVGSEDFAWPDPERELDLAEEGYDLVQGQWCLGHLSDDELVSFLQRARAALRTSRTDGSCEGFIIVKENVCSDSAADGAGRLFDDDDSSITRSDRAFRDVFERAGLEIVRREVQLGFPEELFPVVSYALR